MINRNLSLTVSTVGEEKNKLLIFDNLLISPDSMVDCAKKLNFTPYPSAVERKGYPGVRVQSPAAFGDSIREIIVPIVRSEFDIPENRKVKTLQEAFCLMATPEEELGPLQTIPHFDTTDQNFFAVLLYLCGPEHGGTGLYRHNSTGFESVLPERADQYLDACYEELNSKRRSKRYIDESDDLFTKFDFVPIAYNRLVVYRGSLLHSANILSDISLQASASKGRLTANVFIAFE